MDHSASSDAIYTWEDFRLETRNYKLELTRGGKEVDLDEMPRQLLLVLVERAGELVSKDDLIKIVWGKVRPGSDDTFYTHIHVLRKTLGGGRNKYIRNIPWRGYQFIFPVKIVARGEEIDGDPSNEGARGLATKTEETGALAATAEEFRAVAAKIYVLAAKIIDANIAAPTKYVDPSLSREEATPKREVIRTFTPEEIRGGYWTLDLADDTIAQIKANSTLPKTRRVELRRVDRGQSIWNMRIPGRGGHDSEIVPFSMKKLLR